MEVHFYYKESAVNGFHFYYNETGMEAVYHKGVLHLLEREMTGRYLSYVTFIHMCYRETIEVVCCTGDSHLLEGEKYAICLS